jgi:2-polyprenyl-3-methyl-5-hydroxy-6-metoxy-1,4-benzoquinol methylase
MTNINTPEYWDKQYDRRTRRIDEQRLQYVIGEIHDWSQHHGEMEHPTVLDVGCGDGEMLRFLHAHFPHWLKRGVDICQRTIERNMVESPGFKYDLANAETMSLTDVADVVWCGETLEHLDNPGGAVDNMARALRPGGYLICSVPNEGHNRSPEHQYEFTVWQAMELSAKWGRLRNVTVKGGSEWQSVVWTVVKR